MCANARNKSQHVASSDENTKVDFLVRMYLCGYVACGARAPAQTLLDVLCKRMQHCWTTLR